jgi:hypothetical protein
MQVLLKMGKEEEDMRVWEFLKSGVSWISILPGSEWKVPLGTYKICVFA